MSADLLYKYRALDNWKFVLDILVNSRLHAAPFKDLNDPMEGRYYFFGGTVAQGFRSALFRSKLRRNICSLSKTKTSTLLWSYYAGGHSGVAFGIKAPRRTADVEVRPVRYDSGVTLNNDQLHRSPDSIALDILTQKQLPWEHEREVRVFSAGPFVRVKLVELVLGCRVSIPNATLITAIARKWHPQIRVTKLRTSSLDHPEAL